MENWYCVKCRKEHDSNYCPEHGDPAPSVLGTEYQVVVTNQDGMVQMFVRVSKINQEIHTQIPITEKGIYQLHISKRRD
jgi:hypothetical protein